MNLLNGAIIAAIIGAIISLVGLIITKENKISEFRQAWIDSLRNELAELIMGSFRMRLLLAWTPDCDLSSPLFIEYRKDVFNTLYSMGLAEEKIRLRLNPENNYVSDLTQNIDKLNGIIRNANLKAMDNHKHAIETALLNIRNQSKLILKDEWERVKSGEPTYKWSKRILIAFAFLIIAICLFIGISYYLVKPALC